MKLSIRVSSVALLLGSLVFLVPQAGIAEEEPASRPQTQGELMNETCPFTGKDAAADKFVEYADADNQVFGRIYFCCENCQGNAAGMSAAELKPIYEKAYLTAEDGTKTEYGKAALKVENGHCPVTGNAADGSVTMVYNGASINLCCPGCDEPVVDQPDKYLHNINNAIDAARDARDQDSESEA